MLELEETMVEVVEAIMISPMLLSRIVISSSNPVYMYKDLSIVISTCSVFISLSPCYILPKNNPVKIKTNENGKY